MCGVEGSCLLAFRKFLLLCEEFGASGLARVLANILRRLVAILTRARAYEHCKRALGVEELPKRVALGGRRSHQV